MPMALYARLAGSTADRLIGRVNISAHAGAKITEGASQRNLRWRSKAVGHALSGPDHQSYRSVGSVCGRCTGIPG